MSIVPAVLPAGWRRTASTLTIAAGVVGASFALQGVASAHTPAVQATCAGIHVTAVDYQRDQTNTVTIVIDDKVVVDEKPFPDHYDFAAKWASDKPHSYEVTIWTVEEKYRLHEKETVQPCVTTTTTSPTTTSAPPTTTSDTPSSSETPPSSSTSSAPPPESSPSLVASSDDAPPPTTDVTSAPSSAVLAAAPTSPAAADWNEDDLAYTGAGEVRWLVLSGLGLVLAGGLVLIGARRLRHR